jgi:anti-anti-sigma regulatory factor
MYIVITKELRNMSELTITTSQGQGPVTVLHLSGHLHGNTEQELLDRVRQSHEEGMKHLLLDLSGVDVLTSAGLRAIHLIFNMLTPPDDLEIIRQHGDEPYKSPYFKVVCPNPKVYYILNITGFLQNILIYNNMEDAVNSFAG